ncbi:hypothetical protein SCLCIDRAFT_664997 [Scleroderma citrinum Foug A]|uniref:Uncharacterized protein n=1 Tax=Scleroderma citrinum Foug A TaxID=1036808 RepID=A0A0C3D496_9AGAM|nr:hypothetical protein SCLCIDRAFT_664997 [Scleroderma citrinum Foug A]
MGINSRVTNPHTSILCAGFRLPGYVGLDYGSTRQPPSMWYTTCPLLASSVSFD